MENIATNSAVDIMSFDAVSESEAGYEFELKDKDGITGTGVYLTVLGKHADPVNKWITKIVNTQIRENQIAARKGKQVESKSLEEIKDQNIEGAVIRVVKWRNVKQPFSKELMAATFKRNPHFVDQVIEESDNLGNFTQAQ